MKTSYYILIIAFVSTLVAVFVQEKNLDFLDGNYPAKRGMITTADEASYFQPAENYMEIGEWKDNSTGNSSYVQRPPGYAGIYLLARTISSKNPFATLKVIQVLLFFFSILLVASNLKALKLSDKWLMVSAAAFGLLPMFNGFMYYTLTESVSPFLMLFLLYAFLRSESEVNAKNIALLSLSMVLIMLVRPQLLIFPLILFALLVYRNRKYLILAVTFLPLLFWQIRTYSLEGSWTLHPIYSNTNHSIYRPPHEAMTNLFRIWEYRSDRFHETIGSLIKDTTMVQHELALRNVPLDFQEEVSSYFKQFQLLAMYQRQQFETGIDSSLLIKEEEFVRDLNVLTSRLTGEHLFLAYATTPFRSTLELFSKSHMNLAVYQSAWRGNWLIEGLRYICLILILFSFGITFWYALRKWDDKMGIFAIGILFTVLYLVFVQRLNEERYLTPLLPIAFIISLHGIQRIKKGLTK